MKSRPSEEVIKAFTTLWNSNPTWAVYDAANPDPLNPRFIRMDSEAAYTSETRVQDRVCGSSGQTRWGYCRTYGTLKKSKQDLIIQYCKNKILNKKSKIHFEQ